MEIPVKYVRNRAAAVSRPPVGAPVPGWAARPRSTVHAPGRPLCAAGAARSRGACGGPLRRERRRRGRQPLDLSLRREAATREAYDAWVRKAASTEDPFFLAIVDLKTNLAARRRGLMRIDRNHGVIEVGHINLAPRLQRTRAATEAIYLLMARAFDELGYRRFEWKCDSLNAPSRAAALRFGFTLRGPLPPGDRLQGPQPRHRVVLDHRPRMAARSRRPTSVARSRELRRAGAAAQEACGADRPRELAAGFTAAPRARR